jgi:hypothetical protein
MKTLDILAVHDFITNIVKEGVLANSSNLRDLSFAGRRVHPLLIK